MLAHPSIVDSVVRALLSADTQYLLFLLSKAEESFYEAIDDALTRLSLSNGVPPAALAALQGLADLIQTTHHLGLSLRVRYLIYHQKMEHRIVHLNITSV